MTAQRLIQFTPGICGEKGFTTMTALPSTNFDLGFLSAGAGNSQQFIAKMDVGAAAERTLFVSCLNLTRPTSCPI
jgi:hypothetical protein